MTGGNNEIHGETVILASYMSQRKQGTDAATVRRAGREVALMQRAHQKQSCFCQCSRWLPTSMGVVLEPE